MAPWLTEAWTKTIRRYLAGPKQQFTFSPPGLSFVPPSTGRAGLYIHIPFCRSNCFYCPYNKIPYNYSTAFAYTGALRKEMMLYSHFLGHIEIESVYIGGGTPTTMLSALPEIIETAKSCFKVTGPVCLETNPADLSEDTVKHLLKSGVDRISIGAQTFNNNFLRLLGRGYSAATLNRALEAVMAAPFHSVNIDLMFALPGQGISDITDDLQQAVQSGANQITAYPLFSFPHSRAGRLLALKKVRMPRFRDRYRMYQRIYRYCTAQGLEQASVWSFARNRGARYSSVTRDYFIGIGAGSGSHLPGRFYLNTFSVGEYIKKCRRNTLPVALNMDFTAEMSQIYWFYWRLYDTVIPLNLLENCNRQVEKKIRRLLFCFKLLNLGKQSGENLILTEKGAFWLHLAQNYFSLNYISKLWNAAMGNPWPGKVKI